MNLIKAELFKLRTTSLWWIFSITLVPLYAVSLLINWATEYAATRGQGPSTTPPTGAEVAVYLYTSGQYFGVLLVLLLSAILVTNEFFHLTATTTFLVTPRREQIILAKFVAGVVIALATWLITTVLNLIFVPIVLNQLHFGAELGEPAVWRAVGLNALAFGLWSLVGVGLGVLIRSQIAATLTLSIVYVAGTVAINLILAAAAHYLWSGFNHLMVLVPSNAAELMTSGGAGLPDNPPRWVGAVVLIGYAAVTGFFGTLVTRRRDIG